MRLIATLGATVPNFKHFYTLEDNVYEEYFSFQAIAKNLDIKDDSIYIIGTETTFEKLRDFLGNYNKIAIENGENEAKALFSKIYEISTKNTYLDLTQGFRHLPMLALVASLYVQNLENVSIKNIYYAKTTDPNDNVNTKGCNFTFVLLNEFIDISNISTLIETFIQTAIVPSVSIKDKRFKDLVEKLKYLSNHIFANDIKTSSVIAAELKKIILEIESTNLKEFDKLFDRLEGDLEELRILGSQKEYRMLYGFSLYCYRKNLLMQSLTLLYEAMLSLAEEEARESGKRFSGKSRSQKEVDCLTINWPFDRRNCIKKYILRSNVNIGRITEKFKELLKEIDTLRNSMAHAFTGERPDIAPKNKIQSFLARFENILR